LLRTFVAFAGSIQQEGYVGCCPVVHVQVMDYLKPAPDGASRAGVEPRTLRIPGSEPILAAAEPPSPLSNPRKIRKHHDRATY
jgi:hypothetical protein